MAALAERCGALLATSAVANGLFAGDAWSLGISGGFATPLAVELITGADLVVAWGASLTMWTTRHGALIGPDATVVQVDDDPTALGAQRPVHLGVLGDVGATARGRARRRRGRPGAAHRGGRQADRGRGPVERPAAAVRAGSTGGSTRGCCRPRSTTCCPPRARWRVDSGNFMGYPSAYLAVPDAAGFCFTQAFQSIGLGLATGDRRGAGPARTGCRSPRCGDGGFLMGVAELETAVRLGLGLLVVVYDDAGYGAEFHHFADDDHGTVRFPDTDLAAIARGLRLRRGDRPVARRPRRRRASGSPGRGTARSCSTPRSAPTSRPGGWPRRSRGTEAFRGTGAVR